MKPKYGQVNGGHGLNINTAMYKGDGYEIELVMPVGPGIYEDWLKERGPGLHHVKLETDMPFEETVKIGEEVSPGQSLPGRMLGGRPSPGILYQYAGGNRTDLRVRSRGSRSIGRGRPLRKPDASDMQAGKPPFMGKIIISDPEGSLKAMYLGGAGKICGRPVPTLVVRQYLIYGNSDQLPGIVTEAKTHRRNPSVGIGAGDHLYRRIHA